VLFAPVCIGGLAAFVDFMGGAAEDEPYVKVRVLLFDEDVLLSVGGVKDALCLDDDAVGENEVGGVCVGARGDGVGKRVPLIDLCVFDGFDLACNAVL
jgi:hypothetical protein